MAPYSLFGIKMTTFEIVTLVMLGFTLFGVSGIAIYLFNFGRWVGMVDEKLECNSEDHRRYEELFQGMG